MQWPDRLGEFLLRDEALTLSDKLLIADRICFSDLGGFLLRRLDDGCLIRVGQCRLGLLQSLSRLRVARYEAQRFLIHLDRFGVVLRKNRLLPLTERLGYGDRFLFFGGKSLFSLIFKRCLGGVFVLLF